MSDTSEFEQSFTTSFQQAAEKIKGLPQKPNDDELLKLYGLYKQATVGDVNITRPGFWNPVKKAKWDSWKSFEGYSVQKAENEYIKYVEFLSVKLN